MTKARAHCILPRPSYETLHEIHNRFEADMTIASDTVTTELIDGRPAAAPQALLARLDELGITHKTITHPPVFTVQEAQAIRGDLPGIHSKNLFLRNKAGRMWLVTCEESRQLQLRTLAERLGAKRFSFASRERLMNYLGVTPGAVTPFSVINDHQGRVTIVVDRLLLTSQTVNFHPLVNTMTTSICGSDLLVFLQSVDHEPIIEQFE
jgi:Ala-tRNA(Pro) deacylase